MKKLLGLVILKKKEYNELKHEYQKIEELKAIIEETEIANKMKKLEKEYEMYIHSWWVDSEGNVFQIMGIHYDKWASYASNKYNFEIRYPNNDDAWSECSFGTIEDKDYKQITKDEARNILIS